MESMLNEERKRKDPSIESNMFTGGNESLRE